jgi:SAM-dependent methyltransferase
LTETAEGTAAGEFVYSGEELDALGEAKNYYGWITDRFAPYLGPRIVEVGAGIGTSTGHLLEKRPDARLTAVEPAENNFPRLVRRFADDPRVTPVQGYLDDSLPAASADAVVAVNVMEHVEDDAAFLRHAARVLAPGGHALVFVPALPALYGSLDQAFEHYRRYTRGGLVARLREAGLEPVSVRYINLPGMVAWWLWAKVLRRRTITDRAARFYDRWVVPAVRAVEDRVTLPVGNGLIAVGRKNVQNGGPR